jgi:hypothetical protein
VSSPHPGAAQRPGTLAPATDARIVGERYRLDAWLGSGGRGQVWRAEDLALGRPVAVNLLGPAPEPPTETLTAIMSGYEAARARIISASASAGRHSADRSPAVPPGVAPTVPVDLGSGLPRPRPAVPDPAPTPAKVPGRHGPGLVRSLLTRLTAGLRSPSALGTGADHPLRWT